MTPVNRYKAYDIMMSLEGFEPEPTEGGQWVKVGDVLAAAQPLFDAIKDMQEMLGDERQTQPSLYGRSEVERFKLAFKDAKE